MVSPRLNEFDEIAMAIIGAMFLVGFIALVVIYIVAAF